MPFSVQGFSKKYLTIGRFFVLLQIVLRIIFIHHKYDKTRCAAFAAAFPCVIIGKGYCPIRFYFLFIGYIGCVITLVAIFAIPTNLGQFAQYAWFLIAYTLLNAVFYTANNIAYLI